MKRINQKATQVFNKLIKLMKGEDHLKLDNSNGAFMPINIERHSTGVSFGPIKVDIYSLTHYFKQNGDLVSDPDMTFAISQSDSSNIWPFSYQDQYGYQEGIYKDSSGTWKINKKIQHDHATFAGMWLQNIKHQQNI
ncbi:hypothetical protein HNV12_23035 [Methanococcoides sp. SA1]|nr:hypothetical protein [Methanococcoides sp. SA1]